MNMTITVIWIFYEEQTRLLASKFKYIAFPLRQIPQTYFQEEEAAAAGAKINCWQFAIPYIIPRRFLPFSHLTGITICRVGGDLIDFQMATSH